MVAGATNWCYVVIVRSAITLTLEIKMDLISIRIQILHMGRHPYTVILQISTPQVHSACCLGGIFALGTFRVLTWLAFGGFGFIVFSTSLVALSSISIGAPIHLRVPWFTHTVPVLRSSSYQRMQINGGFNILIQTTIRSQTSTEYIHRDTFKNLAWYNSMSNPGSLEQRNVRFMISIVRSAVRILFFGYPRYDWVITVETFRRESLPLYIFCAAAPRSETTKKVNSSDRCNCIPSANPVDFKSKLGAVPGWTGRHGCDLYIHWGKQYSSLCIRMYHMHNKSQVLL